MKVTSLILLLTLSLTSCASSRSRDLQLVARPVCAETEELKICARVPNLKGQKSENSFAAMRAPLNGRIFAPWSIWNNDAWNSLVVVVIDRPFTGDKSDIDDLTQWADLWDQRAYDRALKSGSDKLNTPHPLDIGSHTSANGVKWLTAQRRFRKLSIPYVEYSTIYTVPVANNSKLLQVTFTCTRPSHICDLEKPMIDSISWDTP